MNGASVLRVVRILAIATVVALGTTCIATDERTEVTIELERVWQYLKAYSLYSDRLMPREQALNLTSPVALVASINDTLHEWFNDTTRNFAGYDYECKEYGAYGSISQTVAGWFNPVTSIGWGMLTDSTAYVFVWQFVKDDILDFSTYDELAALGDSLKGVPNVVLNLVNNPGGDLNVCTAAVELFLPDGVHYLSTTWRRDVYFAGDTGTVLKEPWTTRHDGDSWEGKKIAVLINESTASAAEILAVALRKGLGAQCRLFGRRSYGKGIGQYVLCFSASSNAQLSMTGFRFYPTLTGLDDYHEIGIPPDKEVTGSLKDLVVEAGEWLEPGFATLLDSAAADWLDGVLKRRVTTQPECYQKLHYQGLPFPIL